MLRHVLVCLKPSAENDACRTGALEMARQVDAVLTALYVRALPATAAPLTYPMTGFVVGDVVAYAPAVMREVDARTQAFELEEDRRQKQVFDEFVRASYSAGVRVSTMVRAGDVGNEIVAAAQATDLVILGRGQSRDETSVIGSVTGSIVRGVSRPVLVVPEWIAPLSRIVVAYDGSPGADRALSMAADLAVHWRTAQPEVVLVGITRHETDSLTFLEPARRYLNAYDLPHRVRSAPGDPAHLIGALALNEDASLLCMGAYRHSLMRDVLLGSTTQAVLAAWRRPLMLCH